MASLLRQIVAGPRARHPEAGLDLCYVTDNIIATSGPSGTYPQRAYRNPLDALVKFLDSKHGANWAIWEFRAEGTGYPDDAVYGRIWHFPWPDHHPPPFALLPNIMASMRNWLHGVDAEGGGDDGGKKASDGKHHKSFDLGKVRDKLGKEKSKDARVVVVHCKAGKGRSGTIATSYLISQEGWKAEDALKRFTERRMRPGFGAGVSIPSQLRWVGYVVRWTAGGKKYVERPIEVVEIHVKGLRDGVKISIEGYVDEGRKIKVFHVFKREEREVVRGTINVSGFSDLVSEVMGRTKTNKPTTAPPDGDASNAKGDEAAKPEGGGDKEATDDSEIQPAGADVIYRPSSRVVLPTSDINIDFERRNKAVSNFTMVTSVAHVWFNAFFEGNGPEKNGIPDSSGVFEIEWDALDGIKGSSRKGTKGFDSVSVVWKAVESAPEEVIEEPGEGEPVSMAPAADWTGQDGSGVPEDKKLGLRVTSPVSENVSRANSIEEREQMPAKPVQELAKASAESDSDDMAGVQSHIPGSNPAADSSVPASPLSADAAIGSGSPATDGTPSTNLSDTELAQGQPLSELKTAHPHQLGHLAHHTRDL